MHKARKVFSENDHIGQRELQEDNEARRLEEGLRSRSRTQGSKFGVYAKVLSKAFIY